MQTSIIRRKNPGNRISNGSKVFDVIIIAVMIIVCAIVLIPFMRVIAISVSDPKAINKGMVSLLPVGFNLKSYEVILTDPVLWTYMRNTLAYTAVGTMVSVIFTALCAYPLSIPGFILKGPLTIFLTIPMFFSGGLIPTYIAIVGMGGVNSFWVMIFPGCVTAYNAFIYRSFFQSIPGEMRESAYIDGANDMVIFVRIILPLSTALLATFGLFAAVQYWNLWFKAMIYLHDSSRYPIQMLLRRLIIVQQMTISESGASNMVELFDSGELTPRGTQMAAVMIVMLPILFVYPFAQKYFVKGVMIGSIKG
ncbi:MAG: carbohydrate ABC transporter permease [Oscillospiraceae bacterium]|nr:carbohydrate ABC transporter permease [Oscillospiraceae bacterium]